MANDGGLPEADACVMPDAIRLGGRVQGSTANASANYAASCGNDAEGPEVVYEYRALQDGTVWKPICQIEIHTLSINVINMIVNVCSCW